MSEILITLNDNGRLVCHTDDTLDEWFRSLDPIAKIGLFELAHETQPAEAAALYDELLHLRFGHAAGTENLAAVRAAGGSVRELAPAGRDDFSLAQRTELLDRNKVLRVELPGHNGKVPAAPVDPETEVLL